ncbi:MAG: hypothetical protein U0640_05610 [Phycisphaerales bacterium]
MESRTHQNPSVVCPRCGYDLRGQVDAWHPGYGLPVNSGNGDVREEDVGAKCPVGGVCSECGLVFEWADLFAPVRQLTGLFEVDEKKRARALFKTLWRMMLCWPLWNRLKMQHEIRRVRIVVVVVSCVLAWYLAVAVPWFGWANLEPLENFFFKGQLAAPWSNKRWHLSPFVPFGCVLDTNRWRAMLPFTWFTLAVVQWVLMPICFLLLPLSFQKAKVRRVHLLRGTAYSIGWLLLILHLPALVALPYNMLRWMQMTNFMPFPTRSFVRQTPWLLGIYCLVLSAIWWSVFAGRYLKLPRPWLIGIVLAVVAMLMAVLIVGLMGKGPELVMNTV